LQKNLNKLILLVTSILLMSCSDDDSAKLTVSILPTDPIVVESDISVNGDTVSGPWFKFKYGFKNTGKECLTVIYFTVEVTAGGNKSKTTYSIMPSDFTTPRDYLSILSYKQEDGTFFDCLDTNTSEDESDTYSTTQSPTIFLGGIHRLKEGQFAYNVVLTAIGWVGTEYDQIGRLTSQLSFVTR